MSRGSALAFLLALGVALSLRLPALDRRPLHNDEAVNAVKLAALIERGEYRYDPHEFHGPLLHYAAAVVTRLGGVSNGAGLSDSLLRVTPVLAGVGLILLLLLLRDALGDAAVAGAALLTAVSPAMVFYSRYFIHEMLLVFASLLTLAAGWRYGQSRRLGWAVLGGVGLGLMWATKETFVFALAAAMFAAATLAGIDRWRSRLTHWRLPPPGHCLAAGLATFLVGGVLFASFGANWRGVLDSVLTYETWLGRAGGASAHIHPWYFYFERLLWFHPPRGPVWTEAAIAGLAVLGGVSAFVGHRPVSPHPVFVRFISLYTVALTIVYALIPYKTPWCLLGFWSGAIVMAGVGISVIWRFAVARGPRCAAGILMAGVLAHLGWQAWRAADTLAADRRNPYAYAQTTPDALRLVDRVKSLAHLYPAGNAMPVKVILPVSEWPLPWYWRSLGNVGWWTSPPADLQAPVVLADPRFHLRLDETTGGRWLMAGMFELRPGVFLELYVELDLWRRLVEGPAAALAAAPLPIPR